MFQAETWRTKCLLRLGPWLRDFQLRADPGEAVVVQRIDHLRLEFVDPSGWLRASAVEKRPSKYNICSLMCYLTLQLAFGGFQDLE